MDMPISGKMEKEKYGNEDINRLMEELKSANGGMLDGSVKRNRQACHTMLARLKRDFPDHDPVKSLSHLIAVGKKHPFHGPNLTSFNYLIYHGSKIIQSAKQAKQGQQSPNEYAHSAADALARRLADSEG